MDHLNQDPNTALYLDLSTLWLCSRVDWENGTYIGIKYGNDAADRIFSNSSGHSADANEAIQTRPLSILRQNLETAWLSNLRFIFGASSWPSIPHAADFWVTCILARSGNSRGLSDGNAPKMNVESILYGPWNPSQSNCWLEFDGKIAVRQMDWHTEYIPWQYYLARWGAARSISQILL